MATYECDACGMAVNASCAKCDSPLVDGSLTLDDGTVVQISKCPECEGKLRAHNVVAPIWLQINRAYREALSKPEHSSKIKPLVDITTRAT